MWHKGQAHTTVTHRTINDWPFYKKVMKEKALPVLDLRVPIAPTEIGYTVKTVSDLQIVYDEPNELKYDEE